MKVARRGRPRERSSKEQAPQGFRRAVSYVDTVVVQFFRRAPPPEFRRALVKTTRPFGGRYVRKKIPTGNGFFIFKVWIHQPTEAALRLLAEFEAKELLRLIGVHVALDLIADSFSAAELLRNRVESRLLPSTRAKRIKRSRYKGIIHAVSSVEDTTYYSKGIGAGTEIALYSDRFSKTAYGAPCCHLEYRIKGAKELRAAHLQSNLDVALMSHFKFWKAKLSFWKPPDFKAIARAGNHSAGSRTLESLGSEKNKRDTNRLLRLATHTDQSYLNGYMLFLELRDDARKYNDRPIRLFQKVAHDWALPPSQNALWPTNAHLQENSAALR